ncbi:MAG: IPT/TIG domain-containing protein [Acidobacteriota bacterium]
MRRRHDPSYHGLHLTSRALLGVCIVFGLSVAPPPHARGDPPTRLTADRDLSSLDKGVPIEEQAPGSASVVDGELVWKTVFGGSGHGSAAAIAIDTAQNSIVVGQSEAGWGSPVRPYVGDWDAFVVKFDANGTLVWNTFLGHVMMDTGEGVAVDHEGSIYVVGSSHVGWGSPVRPFTATDAHFEDAFVAKLDADGNLVWNTFLGGYERDYGLGIDVDLSGHACVVGCSYGAWGSPVRPFAVGADGFVARLEANGALAWSTFLGGPGHTETTGIGLDLGGAAYVGGWSDYTWGVPVRPFADSFDAFAAKLDASGALIWNTFLGGTNMDTARGIAVGSGGNAYLLGSSLSGWGTPVRPFTPNDPSCMGYLDAFAAKLDAGGELVWNTFLGGGCEDGGDGITLDTSQNAYVAGVSSSGWGSPIKPFGGDYDGFVAKVDAGGALVWNTFLGGTSHDTANGVGSDGTGVLYVTGNCPGDWGGPGGEMYLAKLAHAPPGPTITQIKSKKAAKGSPATLVGTGFSTTKADNVVYFGKKKAEVKTARTTRLKVKIPKNCKKGKNNVYAVVNGVKSNVVTFTVK